MATLKEKFDFFKRNPRHEMAQEFIHRVKSGKYDQDAIDEGLDLSSKSRTWNQSIESVTPATTANTPEVEPEPKKSFLNKAADVALSPFPVLKSIKSDVIDKEPSGVQNFIKKELQGGMTEDEIKNIESGIGRFGARLLKSTIGSGGILGVAQLPGKAIGAKKALESITMLNNTKADLSSQKGDLLQAIKESDSSLKKQRLQSIIVGLDASIEELDENIDNLQKFAPTAKQAIGTTIAAGATIAGGGLGPGLVKSATGAGAKALVGAGIGATEGAIFSGSEALKEDRVPTTEEIGVGAVGGALLGAAAPGIANQASRVAKNLVKKFTKPKTITEVVEQITLQRKVGGKVDVDALVEGLSKKDRKLIDILKLETKNLTPNEIELRALKGLVIDPSFLKKSKTKITTNDLRLAEIVGDVIDPKLKTNENINKALEAISKEARISDNLVATETITPVTKDKVRKAIQALKLDTEGRMLLDGSADNQQIYDSMIDVYGELLERTGNPLQARREFDSALKKRFPNIFKKLSDDKYLNIKQQAGIDMRNISGKLIQESLSPDASPQFIASLNKQSALFDVIENLAKKTKNKAELQSGVQKILKSRVASILISAGVAGAGGALLFGHR